MPYRKSQVLRGRLVGKDISEKKVRYCGRGYKHISAWDGGLFVGM